MSRRRRVLDASAGGCEPGVLNGRPHAALSERLTGDSKRFADFQASEEGKRSFEAVEAEVERAVREMGAVLCFGRQVR